MSSFALSARFVAGSVLTGIIGATAATPAPAQQKAGQPDFSSNQVGWVGVNGGGPGFEPVPGHLPPVSSDPAHPFVPNGAGRQPTYRIADLTNPNLKPWVKERMKKDNDEVLAGKIGFTARSSCMPAGVPALACWQMSAYCRCCRSMYQRWPAARHCCSRCRSTSPRRCC